MGPLPPGAVNSTLFVPVRPFHSFSALVFGCVSSLSLQAVRIKRGSKTAIRASLDFIFSLNQLLCSYINASLTAIVDKQSSFPNLIRGVILKQCPFCHTQVPGGASVCTGCDAFEGSNTEASSAIKKYFYIVGIPMFIYQLLSSISSSLFIAGLIKPSSSAVNVASAVLILGYLWKCYLPWSKKMMWYRER